MPPIIEVEHLIKDYITYKRGGTTKEAVKSLFRREKVPVHAVADISFTVPEGEIVSILGPNGAGKSTVIKMLTGVLVPTGGGIRVMGYAPYKDRSRYVGHIGAVFGQKSQLIWDIPPVDAFLMNKAIYDIPEDVYQQNLGVMTDLFEVGAVIKKPTRVLSLGERMKCEFMMAMLHSPGIVFLDEPTIGLDLLAKDNIREFIREMNRRGTTFILTSHDVEDVVRLARHVIIINKGIKVFDDSLEALKHYLGDKKAVQITMSAPVPDIGIKGVTVTERLSDCEARLLVDNEILPMTKFMEKLSALGDITDIAIQEQDVEGVMKAIYRGN